MKLLAILAFAALMQQGGADQQFGVRAGYTIEPESLHVGDPGILRIRVVAPAGAKIVFPGAVDSTAEVEPLDPVSVHQETKNGEVEAVATYRFVAWELGLPQIAIGPIRVEHDGAVRELQIGDARVFVLTVLPQDTTQRAPRPARGIALLHISNWPMWVLIGSGFLIAAIVGIWLQRRASRPRPTPAPIAAAKRAFGRLAALDLVGAGEPAKHVAASVDILRNYLAMRNAAASTGLTTGELAGALEGDTAVPVDRVTALLETADGIKFSGESVAGPFAERLAGEAAAIVSEVHRADSHKPANKSRKEK
jgi:hypothetical protein